MPSKHALAEKRRQEQLIPYHAVPQWVQPASNAVFCVSALVILLSPISFTTAVLGGNLVMSHLAFIITETFIRMTTILLLGVMTYLTCELARHDFLSLSEDYMTFPVFLAPDLLFKRKRSWDDIGNVLLGAMLLQDRKGTYEYDLEEAKDKKRLFIYFKSGGHVSLDLNRMPKKSVDTLFRAIESWCISFSRTPVPSSKNRSIGHAPLPAEIPKELRVATFTQMWEDEMMMHFLCHEFRASEERALFADR